MSSREEQLRLLRRLRASVLKQDSRLREEHDDLGSTTAESAAAGDPVEQGVAEESIALRRLRPVLAIKNNEAALVFTNTQDSEVWKDRLTKAKPMLDRAIRAVGRIDLAGSSLEWVGTGWLVADTILVTNRHVAREFAYRDGKGFTFQMGDVARIKPSIDFLQEIDNPAKLTFELVKTVHIEEPTGPDLAFFEVAVMGGDAKLAGPIALAATVAATANAATIGYPAYDSRIPEPSLMEEIFGRVYNKKRLAPGGATRIDATHILHNCTTLGGNSGSVVIDLDSGQALGLHFSGSFLKTNYAVRADIVARRLADLRSGRLPRPETRVAAALSPARPPEPRPAVAQATLAGATATVTLPLTLTVSIGLPRQADSLPAPRPLPSFDAPEDDDHHDTEGVAADYADRAGYRPEFLGPSLDVALPQIIRDANDVLDFEDRGRRETELRYEHFSVKMSRSRRICFFSAVNIDGNLSRKTQRTPWRWDPRIPKSQQIMNECYGNPPKFSRGHMSRREDPAWGEDMDTAKRGNSDSMHVTNTTPQMQAFNAPIWLELEDYALSHAREDDMKISVFSGPYFTPDDPVMYGVRIPLAFWKVIAFVHDDTRRLCATGYEMSQQTTLPPKEEFVFGQLASTYLNKTVQTTISSIAERSGLDFRGLARVDPLATETEDRFGRTGSRPLERFEQIRFVT